MDLWSQLEDLDFADDLALLSRNHDEQMQSKTTELAAVKKKKGLKINRGKSNVMRINTIKEQLHRPPVFESSLLYQ